MNERRRAKRKGLLPIQAEQSEPAASLQPQGIVPCRERVAPREDDFTEGGHAHNQKIDTKRQEKPNGKRTSRTPIEKKVESHPRKKLKLTTQLKHLNNLSPSLSSPRVRDPQILFKVLLEADRHYCAYLRSKNAQTDQESELITTAFHGRTDVHNILEHLINSHNRAATLIYVILRERPPGDALQAVLGFSHFDREGALVTIEFIQRYAAVFKHIRNKQQQLENRTINRIGGKLLKILSWIDKYCKLYHHEKEQAPEPRNKPRTRRSMVMPQPETAARLVRARELTEEEKRILMGQDVEKLKISYFNVLVKYRKSRERTGESRAQWEHIKEHFEATTKIRVVGDFDTFLSEICSECKDHPEEDHFNTVKQAFSNHIDGELQELQLYIQKLPNGIHEALQENDPIRIRRIEIRELIARLLHEQIAGLARAT